jgi:hypothetical protein
MPAKYVALIEAGLPMITAVSASILMRTLIGVVLFE